MFLARDEHDETEIINCPLPDCNYAWCKECQQAIEFIGPKHSCDGTSELDHLMEQQGWKYCPGESVLAIFHLLGTQISSPFFFRMQDAHPENIGMQPHVCTWCDSDITTVLYMVDTLHPLQCTSCHT